MSARASMPRRSMTEAVLYSFRRCPYAMRARMALKISGARYEHREVVVRDKPSAMLQASPKGTVPVLVGHDGTVLEESLDIMRWALARQDPENWLDRQDDSLLAANDGPFKHHLDRYKYATRYEDADPEDHRSAAMIHIEALEGRLNDQPFLCGEKRGFADVAIFPFIRQFAHADREWFDALPVPRTRAWLEGLKGSELFKSIMIKHDQWRPDQSEVGS